MRVVVLITYNIDGKGEGDLSQLLGKKTHVNDTLSMLLNLATLLVDMVLRKHLALLTLR